jgi:ABC-2 type transport system ATP-binding protein
VSQSDAPPAVEVTQLSMNYRSTQALNNLSLTIPAGVISAVLGRNGAGKTTLLETCEGYRRPMNGQVRVLGLDPLRDRKALLPRLGVMLQEGGAWSGVKAKEMLQYAASLYSDPQDLAVLWEQLSLAECQKTPYRRLSGGLKQRLALALALIGRPELVFVDEPTAGMDPHTRREVWQILKNLRQAGVTVVLTTHYLDEAEHLADQILLLDQGRLLAQGSVPEIRGVHSSLEDAFLELTSAPPSSPPFAEPTP